MFYQVQKEKGGRGEGAGLWPVSSPSPFELRCSHGPAPLKRDGGRTDINESRAARYGAKLPPTTSRQLEIVSTVQDALAVARRVEGVKEEKVWVIGGGSVYEQFLPLADELHISWIEGDYEGDVYFPTVDWDRWRSVSKEKRVGFEYEVFARKA